MSMSVKVIDPRPVNECFEGRIGVYNGNRLLYTECTGYLSLNKEDANLIANKLKQDFLAE